MVKSSVLWALETHTLGKHLVLREYLKAWFPIMGSKRGQILFIDGFAGPGEYEKGEEGSPLIALHAFSNHAARGKVVSEVRFVFIEEDPARALHLEGLVVRESASLPDNCHVEVCQSTFAHKMTEILDDIDTRKRIIDGMFVMIDPFGVSGVPLAVIARILSIPRAEIYLSFQYESIRRFGGTSEHEAHLNSLFGSTEWQRGLQIEDPAKKREFFYHLYTEQLRKAGARHVVRFELCKGRRVIYAVFFATQHPKGCDRMKQAIWKVAPWGDYAFRGTRSGQLPLGLPNQDFKPLQEALCQKFGGRGWVKIEKIEEFVASDATDFHTGQLRRGALKPLEQSGKIEVRSPRERKYTYPKGTYIQFL